MASAHRLNMQKVALTTGLIWGIFILILGLFAWVTAKDALFITMMSEWYIGYGPTLIGSIVGGIWGFVDGLICGAVFVWIYNKL